ncbi:MAG: anti-sigma factor antagonist [Candidatus Muiribacterium halophilum]|uniref:Anti-sigma factor antagonist n=1 Tax=Muiribacterium halophilum TaxID=2053465 RepID=A0A2N5ZJ63_MUIH1|nr:MAG: anti-sigma factor antagonist [Candidatus Muirbacterium halophilum]
MLDIHKEQIKSDIVLLKLKGKLIYDTEEDVNLAFQELLNQEKSVFLDISELNYINSSGLGIFINLLKNVKKIGKRLIVINPSPEVKVLFEITSLDKMFEITKTLEEAIELL